MPGQASFHPDGPGSTRDRPALSVVVPMYQESARVAETARDVLVTLRAWGLVAEFIPVDDGSTDGSAGVVDTIAAELAGDPVRYRPVRLGSNAGKGAAVRRGLEASTGAWVLMMDADNSARLSELPKLAAAAQRTGSGLVVGSRAVPEAEVEADPRRRAAGLVFRTALGMLGLSFVHDTQCGFKLYRRDAALLCAEHGVETGFAFDIEHLGLCTRAGLGVAEVGIRWTHKDGGTIRVVRDGVAMLARAVRIRARLRGAPRSIEAEQPTPNALVELKPVPSHTPAAGSAAW